MDTQVKAPLVDQVHKPGELGTSASLYRSINHNQTYSIAV
jgi:hypothetical protein